MTGVGCDVGEPLHVTSKCKVQTASRYIITGRTPWAPWQVSKTSSN